MKLTLRACLILFILVAFYGRLQAQSPYLSFEAMMDADHLEGEKFRLVASFCMPVQPSAVKTVYGKDTSSISFKSLEKHMIKCSSFFESDSTGDNVFSYGNQNFGYEKIIVLRVIRLNQEMESMQMIVPLRYQSFLTFIRIRDIVFMPGKTIWIDLPDTRERGSLKVNISMKEYAYTEQKFPG